LAEAEPISFSTYSAVTVVQSASTGVDWYETSYSSVAGVDARPDA